MLRYLAATFLSLIGSPLYDNLGLGRGNTVLALVSVGLIPIPLVLIKYGESLRTRYRPPIE
jgi:hypothetical protein